MAIVTHLEPPSSTGVRPPRPGHDLPPWRSVLAVVAHPDDESFGLGGLLAGFAQAGVAVHVVTFTHGEASTLHGVRGNLHDVRAAELAGAAEILGLSTVRLLDYADGKLDAVPPEILVAALQTAPAVDGLLVFDTTGITGHADHIAATRAGLAFAGAAGLPVLGWTIPRQVAAEINREIAGSLIGRCAEEIDLCVRVDRGLHRRAARAHASQAASPLLWRRLQLLGDCEHLLWLPRDDRERV